MAFSPKIIKMALSLVASIIGGGLNAQEEIALEQDLQPIWEVGAFAAAFNTPEYPGADQNQNNIIAAPYFVYRGETFRIGDGSIARAVAIDKSWYELDLSLDGSFNANSDENPAREDMPDLDFILEVGPEIRMRLKQFEFEKQIKGEVFLNLQARAAFSTDLSSINNRGFVFQPEFTYRQRGWPNEKTGISVSVSSAWATEKLHDYFYQVDNEFVTDGRLFFDADGGYLGTQLSIGLSYRATRDIRVFLGARTSIQSGAANEDSPLFAKSNTYSYGVGMVWRLWESEERVAGR